MSERKPATITYAGAGVDIDAGERAVDLMREHVASTRRPEVFGTLGGFSGGFAADFARFRNPVLLSSTDGVGTKVAIAQTLDRHDTVGIDLVAMVVDDLVCDGGEPLFLLDYIACGRLVPERIERIVAGIAEGCRIAGCALVGGETAEHPGLMDPDAYDLAAFAVGVAERDEMPGPHRVSAGDVVIGLASSGLHSNGYSLVRRVLLEHDLDLAADPGIGRPLGEALLEPTTIYAPLVLDLLRAGAVGAAAHITGGGLPGNLVRILPEGLAAVVDEAAWPVPPVIEAIGRIAGIERAEMRRAFNMGIGMALVAAPPHAGEVVAAAQGRGIDAFVVGEIRSGERGVTYR